MLGIFLDTETNGLDAKVHKILEIAFKLVDVSNGALIDSFESLVSIQESDWKLSDPVSLKVCGLTLKDLEQGLPVEEVSSQVKALFKQHHLIRGKAVFICQNPSFDRSFFSQLIDIASQEQLYLPYHWLDLASMYWGSSMKEAKEGKTQFPWDTGFTKDKIAQKFHLEAEAHPHRAMNGVDHLLKCYEAVVGFPEKI
jgi:DNA polymerase-3 subunit epsilon/oligoribonuclease